MKLNVAFSAFEYRNITPQSPLAETQRGNEAFLAFFNFNLHQTGQVHSAKPYLFFHKISCQNEC